MKYLIILLVITYLITVGFGSSSNIYQAEDGILNGTFVSNAVSGYKGKGYVDGFDKDEDSCTVTVNIEEDGIYEIIIGYSAPFGYKENALYINNVFQSNVKFNPSKTFTTVSAGFVPLKRGKNIISIVKNWGWIYLDYFEIRKGEIPTLKVEPKLVTPNPSPEAVKLMEYLVSIFGKYVLSGQAGIMDCYWIFDATGKFPALCGFDMMDYSSSRVEFGAKSYEVENAIRWWNEGGIVQFQWHWNAPKGLYNLPGKEWWRGFYTKATSFDIEYAINHPESEDYKLLIRDLDAIAEQLKRLRDAKVPILWRPLHEAEGRWFWWGAKGPESFKKLYYLLYELLTYHYKLNNLIWVWNAIDPDWLVEDEFFDIVGVDFYAPAGDFGPLKFKYDQALELAKGEKPVALTENGPIPDPDILFDSESYFLWFMPWWGKFVFDGIINPKEHLIKVYNSERVITLDKIN